MKKYTHPRRYTNISGYLVGKDGKLIPNRAIVLRWYIVDARRRFRKTIRRRK